MDIILLSKLLSEVQLFGIFLQIDAWEVSVLDFKSDVLAMPYVDVSKSKRCIFTNTPFPQFDITLERYCTGPVKGTYVANCFFF